MIDLIEMMESALALNENLMAEKRAMQAGISIQKTKDGKFVVLQHPKLGREVVKTMRGNVRPDVVQKFIRARGKVQEMQEAIMPGAPIDAQTPAPNYAVPRPQDYKIGTKIKCIKSGLLKFIGNRAGIAQIWLDDDGTIVGNDGNNLTLAMKNAGRVVVPKTEFPEKFDIVALDGQ